jgi:phosphoserine phosphatase RsbU/P
MERELELAREIQQNLLPSQAPRYPGWDMVGTNTPCYTIGGDYYDFIERPKGLAVALGDVSGKGASAALMMMVLRATVHFACQREAEVLTILSQTNGVMYHNSPTQFFVTFFLGDLETGTGKMRYVNAGHIPPILYRAKSRSMERLAAGGTVLGLFAETPFEAGEVEFGSGDILLVFTDGLSEAWGPEELEFGEDRMAALIRDNASLPARELELRIQTEVEAFTGGARATDDRTLIVVKRS